MLQIEEECKDQQVTHTSNNNNNTHTTKHTTHEGAENIRTRASTRVRKALKLSALLGDSEEQRIEQYISKCVVDMRHIDSIGTDTNT